MHKVFRVFLVLCTLFVSACSEAAFGVANLPLKFSDVQIEKDVPYGDKDFQDLDIYIPFGLEGEKAPVVIFIHGGRWTFGNKDQYGFIGNSFAQKGYIAVLINHRKYPEIKFPDFVEDAAMATAWVYNNISKYNGDINNIFISGHSSGAHLGALLVADQSYLEPYNLSPMIIKGFAGMSGPYDFEPEEPDLKDLFGPPKNYPQMQVPTFIDGDEAPMLLLWGEDDKTVIYRNIDRLKNKINEQSGNVSVITYKDMDHIGIIKDFAWVNMKEKIVLNDIVDFFDTHKK